MARNLTQWYSHHLEDLVDGISLDSAKRDGEKARQLAERCLRITNEPAFNRSIASQAHVVGFLATFGGLYQELCAPIREAFLKRTGIHPVRFDHMLTMEWEPELERKIRASLKAARSKARSLLPGEDIFPRNNWLGQYLNYSEDSPSPLAYHFWCGCALLGAACRRNVYFTWRYHLYPNYYLFLVGPSAIGKGMAIDRTTPLVEQANDLWRESLSSLKGMPGPCANGWWPNRQIVVLPSKVTPQDAVRALVPSNQDDGKGAVPLKGVDSVAWLANGEASSLLQREDKLAEAFIRFVTEGYNCEDRGFGSGTIARGVEQLRNQCFNIVLGSTMEWINTGISQAMMDAGFVRRCFFVSRGYDAPAPHYYYSPPPPADPLQASVLAGQMAMWMGVWVAKEVEPSGEGALRAIGDLKRKVEESIKSPSNHSMLPYHIGKFNTVMKTAVVLAANKFTSPDLQQKDMLMLPELPLTAEDVELATALVENEEGPMEMCFSRMGEHRTATEESRVIAKIRAYGKAHGKPINKNDLRDACRSVPDLDATLSRLLGMGLIVDGKQVHEKGGRPAVCYWDPDQLTDR